jgi:protein-S-isoprenylcysteine O-methyltransferase Ste14
MPTTTWDWIREGTIAICWGAFCLVWLVGAIYNAEKSPAVQRRSSPFSMWIVGLALYAVAVWFIPDNVWAHLSIDAPWLRVLGILCLLFSTAFTLWARGVLGLMWSSTAVARAGHQLRTTGPYRITRHPIYTGILGMLLGTMLLNGLGIYILLFVAGISILEIKLHQEERLLRETFGVDYVLYQRRVPQLIPGLPRTHP